MFECQEESREQLSAAPMSVRPYVPDHKLVLAHPNLSRRAITHAAAGAPFARVTDVCRPARSDTNASVSVSSPSTRAWSTRLGAMRLPRPHHLMS